MRKVFFFIILTFLVGVSSISVLGQANVHLKGKVIDTTQGAMPGATVKVFKGTGVPKAGTMPTKEGLSGALGDFDLELPAGDYHVEVTAPDFKTFSQAVKLAANTAPLSVTLEVKEFETVVDVAANNNEVGIDPEASLTTDTITGDQLLDLPDNEDDLLTYLTELAAARGIVDGDLDIRVDGFGNTRLPSRNEIQEIRIVNSSFSADSSSSGPRIEIVTRPGTGMWTGNVGFTFQDESLNAAAPLTSRKPPMQRRNFNAGMSGPIMPGRITARFNVTNNQSEQENSSVRAVGINGPINQGVPQLNDSRSISFQPTVVLNKKNQLNAQLNYSDSKGANGGVNGFTLPERATNSNGHSWQANLREQMTLNARMTNEVRFQFRQQNSATTPVNYGRAINVQQSFNGGGTPSRSQSQSRDFQVVEQFRWQTTKTLTLTMNMQLDRHKNFSDSESNYLGTYQFSSLHDYCYAEALAHNLTYTGSECEKTRDLIDAANGGTAFIPGTQIAITGVPTQFTITSGDPLFNVNQTELSAYLQGEWRMGPRAQLSFGARYQMQQHLHDYNNIAPTAGLSYQLSRKQNWQTIVRAGGRMNYNTFNMSAWEQLLRASQGSSQFNYKILNPSYPNPDLGSLTLSASASNSVRTRAEDYVAPYTIQPTLSLDQTLPKGHRLSFNFQISRGVHQNRNRNVNAPFPGTPLSKEISDKLNYQSTATTDPGLTPAERTAKQAQVRAEGRAQTDALRPLYPYIADINQQESVGTSMGKNFSIQYRLNNKTILWNKVQVGGQISWNMNWAMDDSGNPVNPYDLAAEWGRSGNDQRHRITGNINVRVPWNLQFTLQQLGWSSGRPYTITTGKDANGDGSNNDRPVGVKKNSETGPGTFSAIGLNITKTLIFHNTTTPSPSRDYAEPQGGGGFGGGGGGFGGGGGNRGNGGPGGQRISRDARQVQISIRVTNLLNSTIRQGINGNQSSSLFGQLTGGGSGRTIQLGINTNLGRLF